MEVVEVRVGVLVEVLEVEKEVELVVVEAQVGALEVVQVVVLVGVLEVVKVVV